MVGLVILVLVVADGARRAAARRRGRAARRQHDAATRRGRTRAPTSRSAPTTSGAACSPSSSGARGSACSSASPRRSSRSSIGSVVGIIAGFFGGRTGGVLMRITEWFLVIPFLPLAIVLASVLGPSIAQHHPRHRDHVVAVDRAADPRAGAHGQGAAVRRPQPRARRLRCAHHGPSRPAERRAADLRQPHAHRADRDPVGDHAVVPRARRPVARVVGQELGGRSRRAR